METRVGFKYKISIKSVSPWLIVIDNFLSELDIEKLTGKLAPEQWQAFPKADAEKNSFSGEVAVCRDECRQVRRIYLPNTYIETLIKLH